MNLSIFTLLLSSLAATSNEGPAIYARTAYLNNECILAERWLADLNPKSIEAVSSAFYLAATEALVNSFSSEERLAPAKCKAVAKFLLSRLFDVVDKPIMRPDVHLEKVVCKSLIVHEERFHLKDCVYFVSRVIEVSSF
jgi:hypothetical protein